MKKHYYGIDVLRGLGIFMVIILHTAFYFYHDIYTIDLNNPTLIITLIGFLLMFAGLFAMISGFVYTLQYTLHTEQSRRLKGMLISALSLLIIAYLYFIFTGPGLIHFDTQSMDESLFVGFINQQRFTGISLDRLLYVDSLVMLSINIALLTLCFKLFSNYFIHSNKPYLLFIFSTLFLVISYLRIPLYPYYLNAREENRWLLTFLLNWFVAKNNPILPFFAFALYGAWFAMLLRVHRFKNTVKRIIPLAILFIILGALGYILAPETMLDREIDVTWYFIMVIQIGLFLNILLCFIWYFDIRQKDQKPISTFLSRFGIAGLTPFFFESVVSAIIFFLITLFIPLELGIPGALIYGIILALAWGFFLIYWQTKQYRYGLEWLHTKFVKRYGGSTKAKKLEGDMND